MVPCALYAWIAERSAPLTDLVISAPQTVIDLIDRAAEQQGTTRNGYIYILLINALWGDLGPAAAFDAECDLKRHRQQLKALDPDSQ